LSPVSSQVKRVIIYVEVDVLAHHILTHFLGMLVLRNRL
jgi:hypothetical protein